MTTHYSVEDAVAIIRFDNPPVNGLSHAIRADVRRGLRTAFEDANVRAVVLAGGGGSFSAGADISEFGTPNSGMEPSLSTLIAEMENAVKPVIAAIEGTCFGGGLELALGAHYRVATPTSRLGLPEVTLGLVPGAGGTQRLPRALDLATAAEMISSGTPRTAEVLASLTGQRLIDRLVDHDVVPAAARFAAEVAAVRPVPLIRDFPVPDGGSDVLAEARQRAQRRSRGFHAPLAALDLVEKATTSSFEDGLAAERQTFLELVRADESHALRHVFFAERLARKIPGVDGDTPTRPVDQVAVIGAGTMGGGIAMNFLDAGIPVTVLETSQAALDRGLATIRRNYQAQVDKGKLTSATAENRMGVLATTLDYRDVAQCDLVVEAVFEDMDVKRSVFTRLDEVTKTGAILASNTSTLDLDAIAGLTSRPHDVVGMHFFSPANVMKLLEVVRGRKTADDVLMTAMEVGRRIGKTGVVSGVCDGFIGNRMLAKYRAAASRLLQEGATPAQIDAAIEDFGFAMGPFRMADLAGNDIGWAVRKRRYAEDPDFPRDEIADALCEMGRFGQKTGSGWYDYQPGSREPQPSPVVDALVAAHSERQNASSAEFSRDEIVRRLIFSLVDEGARILDEDIAVRASDIDVVYVSGYGFPRHRGGPMFYADTFGLDRVVEALREFTDGAREPARLLQELASAGKTFNGR
ncbi:3-hydroxyacyl-CoA dehydrogenase NAD-binding domain-containing protein [Saccharopolyspora griseoalba]|uniref:3-hydroxyacyl-CoA dehydrogenase NAD-binding domain-containing protein n=1 Tax=Saccharopolyspora griseoalba TaxID=1431848 RepID=A0ABW2LRT5_9PSEU